MIETERADDRSKGAPLALRVLMGILWIGSAAWVVSLIVGQLDELGNSTSLGPLAIAIIVAAAGYCALTCSFLATPWWWLLGVFGKRPKLLSGVEVWARTQIGRYLPGNVAHYLGRHVLGRRLGIGHHELIGASLLELLSIVAAAVVVMALLGAVDPALREGTIQSVLPVALAIVIVGFVAWPVADRIARRLPWIRERVESLPRLSARKFAAFLTPAVAMHVAFLCGTGVLFWIIANWGWPSSGRVSLVHAIRAYALAWTIGTLAPGVPAGAGVREAVIVQDLGPAMGDAEAAAAAIALRVATISGDVLTFVVGWAIRAARTPGQADET